jgi:hypothetical protein
MEGKERVRRFHSMPRYSHPSKVTFLYMGHGIVALFLHIVHISPTIIL